MNPIQIKRLLLAGLFLFSLFGNVFGNTLESEEYGYRLVIPDSCQITELDQNKIIITGEDFTMSFIILKADNKSSFPWSKVYHRILNTEEASEWIIKPDTGAWYNALKSSVSGTYRQADGTYSRVLASFRAKTLIILQAFIPSPENQTVDSIMNSLTLRRDVKSYFLTMRANIGGWVGTLIVTVILVLGYFRGKYRNKYIRSAKQDKKANCLRYLFSALSCLLFAGIVISLKDCIPLALIITGITILIWFIMGSNNTFLKSVLNGIFSI